MSMVPSSLINWACQVVELSLKITLAGSRFKSAKYAAINEAVEITKINYSTKLSKLIIDFF